jgi:hypothetical protein
MNERDRKTPVSTWPPPGLVGEKGNSNETVIAHVPPELLQRMLDSGAVAIDDPDRKEEESPG